MSFAKRALEDLLEFAEVAEPEPEFVALTVWRITSDEDLDALLGTEEALTEEEQDWLMWLSSMWDDTSDVESAIEDDYDWIRGGC